MIDLWKTEREDATNKVYKDKNGKPIVNVRVYNLKDRQNNDKPCCKMWFRKALKPKFNYCFGSIESRDKFVEMNVTNALTRENEKFIKKAKIKELKKDYKPSIKVGDIFHCSYGYNMILNEFWQVVSVKGKKIGLQRVNVEYDQTGFLQGNVRPIKDSFFDDKVKTKILQIHFDTNGISTEYIRMDYNSRAYKVNNLNKWYLQDECD